MNEVLEIFHTVYDWRFFCYSKHKTVFQVSILSIIFVALYSSSLKIDFYTTGTCNKHTK